MFKKQVTLLCKFDRGSQKIRTVYDHIIMVNYPRYIKDKIQNIYLTKPVMMY